MKDFFVVEKHPFVSQIDRLVVLGEVLWRYDYQDNERAGLIVASKSKQSGWEEVSIDIDFPTERCPLFDEMAMFKDIFWNETEVAMQVHPAQSVYVNVHPYTLHLWRNNRINQKEEKKLKDRIIEAYQEAQEFLPNTGVMLLSRKQNEKKVIINCGNANKPTWDEICRIKKEFWAKEEAAVQFNLGAQFDCGCNYIILWDAKEFKLP